MVSVAEVVAEDVAVAADLVHEQPVLVLQWPLREIMWLILMKKMATMVQKLWKLSSPAPRMGMPIFQVILMGIIQLRLTLS